MLNKKSDDCERWNMCCFCIPLRNVCIFFGIVQLVWALNAFVEEIEYPDGLDAKMTILVFGICASLLIYGAYSRRHAYLWPSVVFIALACLLLTIATIMMRVTWDQRDVDEMYGIQLTNYEIDGLIVAEVFIILLLLFIVPLNYAVYSYAVQLQADERAKTFLTQQHQYAQFV